MKIVKKACSILLAACICISMTPLRAQASPGLEFHAYTSGSGNSIRVKKVTYEGEITDHHIDRKDKVVSEIEIDFRTKVSWMYNAKVSSVKDNKGKSYRGYLLDADDDGCDIGIAGMKHGRTYTIEMKWVRPRGSRSYRMLTVEVKIPSAKSSSGGIKITRASVDEEDNEVDIKFASKVSWKRNAKVSSIKDNKGKSYKGYLADTDDDDCEIYIPNLKGGRTYTIKISGVKPRGSSSYKTVTVKVKAPARRHGLTVKKVEYDEDYDDGRMEWTVSIDFNKDIQWKESSCVIIKDAQGKQYSSETSYVEWDHDECEAHLSERLQAGGQYTYEVRDVKPAGAGKYMTLSGTFTANSH